MSTHGYLQVPINLQEKSQVGICTNMEQGTRADIYLQGEGQRAIPPSLNIPSQNLTSCVIVLSVKRFGTVSQGIFYSPKFMSPFFSHQCGTFVYFNVASLYVLPICFSLHMRDFVNLPQICLQHPPQGGIEHSFYLSR